MSLFDDASVVITPNGQKAGKLYSIKPTDGSGDLSVTRATSATRVDANGLVEIPRTNLVTYSEDFTNSNWTKVATTISSNATTAPNGTLTADKIIPSSANSSHSTYQTVGSIGDVRMLSCYVKKIDYRYVTLQYGTASCRFDFDTLTFTGGTNNGYEALPNGWYRIYTNLTAAVNARFTILIPDNSGNISYIGDGTSGTFIWGTMVQEGNVATEYITTVASIRTKFAGITQDGSSASNIPRLDYTNGSCPSILVEPQRTNLKTRSNDWTNSTFTLTNVTQSQSLPQPLFGATALQIRETTANSSHVIQIQPDAVLVIGQVYTRSFYVKPTPNRTVFNFSDAGQISNDCRVNLSTKTVISKGINVGDVFFKDQIDGIIRVEITFTATGVIGRPTINIFLNNTTNLYIGDVNEGIDLYNIQYELGAYATSYIFTTSASVTRNADVISKTGISSLINSVEGCFYVEAKAFVNGGSFRQFSLSNGTDNSRLTIGWSSVASRLLVRLDIGGTNIINTDILSFNQTSNNKVLFKWGGGNFKVFINGVEKLSLTSLTMPTANLFTKLGFDRGSSAGFFEGNVNEVIVFPTQLSDQECINLTTL
jgi:hypothetical protein